jgi:phosphate-selective porin OprO/OprP
VLPLIERALDASLTPQRDVGLQLWGDVLDAFVRYEIGIFNGAADGAITDVDNNHAKTYGGRLFLRPFRLPSLKGLGDLGVGLAVSTGNEKGTAANPALGVFRSAGQNTIYAYLVNATDPTQTVFALKRHTRVNPQLYYYYGSFGLLAEWVKEYQELGKGGQDGAVNHQGGHVTVSYAIGGDVTYEGVKPKKVADWATKELGAVELAARFNWLDLDDVSFQGSTLATASSVTKAQGFAVGLNWWLNRNIRASGDWEYTQFDGPNGATRPTEKMIIGRFQVVF